MIKMTNGIGFPNISGQQTPRAVFAQHVQLAATLEFQQFACCFAPHHYSQGRVTIPKRINFWKTSKGGGGYLSIQNYVADFGPLNMIF